MGEGKSLTETFTDAVFNKHTLIHLALMAVFMTLPMVAAAVPTAGAATLGDLFVQSGHMYLGMAKAGFSSLPVGADMVTNAIHGQFAANTYAMGSMMPMPGMEGAMGGMPMGVEHAAAAPYTPAEIDQIGQSANAFGVDPDEYTKLILSHE